MRLYLFQLLVLIVLFSSTVKAQVFTADMANSDWVAASNSPICSLTHNVPGFGKAVFTHKAGGGALFYLEVQNKIVFPLGETTIETLPPVWRSNVAPMSLGQATAIAGNQPIKLATAQAAPLLIQLTNGIRIVFTSQPRGALLSSNSSKGSANVVRVILEAKNFAPAYKTYQQCTGEYIAPSSGSHAFTNSSAESTVAGVSTSRDVSRVASYIKRDAQVYGAAVNSKSSKPASAQTFEADLASADWKIASSPFACSLTHNIPAFGKAAFSRKAGGEEIFYLESQDKTTFPAGVTNLETLPPIWRSDLVPVNLTKVTAITGEQPITLESAQITQLVTQLTVGTKVMFTSQAAVGNTSPGFSATGSNVVRVVLGAKNFAASHKNYLQCVNQLIPYSFAQVARTLINYPEKSEGLSASAKIELAKVARYVKADSSVLGVLVDGHGDDSGTSETNEAKAKKEAEWVAAYLVEQGIAAEKITTRSHSNKYPIATNKTPEGRAKNRRVTVRLDTESTRREIEKKIAEIKAAADKEEAEKVAHQISSIKTDVAEQQKSNSKTGDTKNPEKTAAKANSESASSRGKMTPEEIRKLVEGLDLIDGK